MHGDSLPTHPPTIIHITPLGVGSRFECQRFLLYLKLNCLQRAFGLCRRLHRPSLVAQGGLQKSGPREGVALRKLLPL